MNNKLIHTFSLFAACSVFTFNCYAYEDPCVSEFLQSHVSDTGDVQLEMAYFLINECVLGDNDTTKVAEKYGKVEVLIKDTAKNESKRTEIKGQVTVFLQQVRTRQQQSLGTASEFTDILERQEKLTSLINEVSTQIGRMSDYGKSITSIIHPDTSDDEWQSMGDASPYNVSFKSIILGTSGENGACTDAGSKKCKIALESMTDWLRFQNAAGGSIHEYYSNARLYEFQDYTVLREERWYSFFEATNYPMLWESLINQQFDRFTYVIGDYGLAEPPTEQLTVIRPSVAAGFANGHGQSPTPELVLEVVGYTTWDWDEADAVNRWGLSLIGTLGEYKENNDTKSNVGVGVLLHTPTTGISLGWVAREHGKNGLIVTFDLIDLWDDRKKKVKSALSKIDQIRPE